MSSSEVDKIKMEVEASRVEVMQAEKEISTIKQALRALGPPGSTADTDEDTNSLKVTVSKVTGLPDTAKPVMNFQLSSPIESQTITQLFDPLNPDLEGSVAHFKGVETENATLTVQVSDADIPLGSSAVLDVKPLTEMDVLGGGGEKITKNMEIAIVPDDADAKGLDDVVPEAKAPEETTEETTEETNTEGTTEETPDKDDNTESDEEFVDAKSELGETPSKVEEQGGEGTEGETKEQDDSETKPEKEDEAAVNTEAEEEGTTEEVKDDKEGVITKTASEGEGEGVETSLDERKPEGTAESDETPDIKEEEDNKEEEKAESPPSALVPTCFIHSQIEFIPSTKDKKDMLYILLNKASKQKAIAVDKLRKSAAALNRTKLTEAVTSTTGGTVKAGFLNKKQPAKKEAMFLVRWYEKILGPTSMVRKVFPIAKNYILFFGGIALMHFQGQQLSLPPPV